MLNFSPKDLIFHRLFDNTNLLKSNSDDSFELLYPFLKSSTVLAHFQIENMTFLLCKALTISKGILPSMELTYIRAIKKLSTGMYLETITRINLEEVYQSEHTQIDNFDVWILYEPLTEIQMKY